MFTLLLLCLLLSCIRSNEVLSQSQLVLCDRSSNKTDCADKVVLLLSIPSQEVRTLLFSDLPLLSSYPRMKSRWQWNKYTVVTPTRVKICTGQCTLWSRKTSPCTNTDSSMKRTSLTTLGRLWLTGGRGSARLTWMTFRPLAAGNTISKVRRFGTLKDFAAHAT